MYIATGYFDTKFKQSFKKGDVVPTKIAEAYPRKVRKDGDQELLVETPTAVEVVVSAEDIIEDKIDDLEDKIDDLEDDLKEIKNSKKGKKKGFWN